MIKIKPLFEMSEIEKAIDDHFDKIEYEILRQLAYIGEKCVNYARDHGSYKDQTGNLRSSIGYGVYKDGKTFVDGDFKLYKQGHDGLKKGKETLREAAREHNKGCVLIVTAGMEYAYYVESYHNLDVLTGSELLADRLAERMLSELLRKL